MPKLFADSLGPTPGGGGREICFFNLVMITQTLQATLLSAGDRTLLSFRHQSARLRFRIQILIDGRFDS